MLASRTAVTARRMISGAGEDSGMDSIIGKNVILLCNVKPRTFFGVESSVMVLFSTDESTEVRTVLTVRAYA